MHKSRAKDVRLIVRLPRPTLAAFRAVAGPRHMARVLRSRLEHYAKSASTGGWPNPPQPPAPAAVNDRVFTLRVSGALRAQLAERLYNRRLTISWLARRSIEDYLRRHQSLAGLPGYEALSAWLLLPQWQLINAADVALAFESSRKSARAMIKRMAKREQATARAELETRRRRLEHEAHEEWRRSRA